MNKPRLGNGKVRVGWRATIIQRTKYLACIFSGPKMRESKDERPFFSGVENSKLANLNQLKLALTGNTSRAIFPPGTTSAG